jgi:hypothetical protein
LKFCLIGATFDAKQPNRRNENMTGWPEAITQTVVYYAMDVMIKVESLNLMFGTIEKEKETKLMV